MAFIDVFFDTLTNNFGMFFQEISISCAHFSSHFVAYVNQLAKIRVIIGMPRDVAKRIGKFRAAPQSHFFFGRRLAASISITSA